MVSFRDNPDVDIYGANLFNRALQKRRQKIVASLSKSVRHQVGSSAVNFESEEVDMEDMPGMDLEGLDGDGPRVLGAESCESVLVCTGVYNGSDREDRKDSKTIVQNYNHRDFIMDPSLRVPMMTTDNVLEAVKAIFAKEKIGGFS